MTQALLCVLALTEMMSKLLNAIGIAVGLAFGITLTGMWLMLLAHLWQVARIERWL